MYNEQHPATNRTNRLPEEERVEDQKVQELLAVIKEKDTFAHKLGMEILEAADGRSRVTMPIDESTANALGNVHGGAIFSLADMAFAAASNSEGIVSVGIQANIHYMAACPSSGRLYATAEKVSESRRLAYFYIKVFTPEDKLIAACQMMVYRMRKE
jgi:acyl-CoA thioesterase